MRAIKYVFLLLPLLLTNIQQAHSNDSATNICAVSTHSSGKLFQARELFENQCSAYDLVDCDPIEGGGWQCASEIIGLNAPRLASPTSVIPTDRNQNTGGDGNTTTHSPLNTTNTPTDNTTVVDNTITGPDSNQPDQCYAVATGLFQSKVAFGQQCASYEREDCDPLGENRWVCSSAKIFDPSEIIDDGDTTTTNVTNNVGQGPDSTTVSSPTVSAPINRPTPTNTAVGRLNTNDLLSLHYDNCPDKDDGHAIPAGKSVVENFSINNVMVVNGTCGDSIKNRFNPDSNAVVQAAWGNEYLDAHGNNYNSVVNAANRWASTLSNGAKVWVAEGGQSDFTADVVRRIEANYSGINLKGINVIQHSAGATAYNEAFTNPGKLAYLKNKTSYKAIPTGNAGNNGSANLNQQSQYFVVTARSSRFSVEWNAGFRYLRPDCAIRTENCKLDFSDTVELLYIVGDSRTTNVNNFADRYLK